MQPVVIKSFVYGIRSDHFAQISLFPVWDRTQSENEMKHMNSKYTTTISELDILFGFATKEKKQLEDFHPESGNFEQGLIGFISGDR